MNGIVQKHKTRPPQPTTAQACPVSRQSLPPLPTLYCNTDYWQKPPPPPYGPPPPPPVT